MSLESSFQFRGWTVRFHGTPHRGDDVKQPVLFVHGTPWSSDVFQPLAKALESTGKFKTYLYDLPGYGLSQQLQSDDSSTGNATFEEDTSVKFQALVLSALLHHLNLDRNVVPGVIAHDIAGAIVLRAHLLHDCNFRSILLMDTNAVLPWGDGFYKLARSRADTFLELPANIFEAVVRAVIRSACHNPKVILPAWEDTLARHWVGTGSGQDDALHSVHGQKSFIRQIAQANDRDIAEMLDENMYEKVRCPVKIVWGSDDKWIPEEKMRRLASLLGNRLQDFVIIDNAGHLVMLDQPERLACEPLTWLERS